MYTIEAGQQGGQVTEPDAACVVYDTRTGHVAHIHETFSLERAQPIGKEDLESLALEMAARHQRDTAMLRVLHISPSEVRRDAVVNYRVDLKTLELVAEPEEVAQLRRGATRNLLLLLLSLLAGLLGGLLGAMIFFWLR